MHPTEVRDRIHRFPQWHYQFELLGHKTPIYDPQFINRHEQRKRYVLPPLLQVCGGSLKGKRVLDLGCNAGFWSLAAIESGCDFVLGIDARQMHIEQANLVFEIKGVRPARYRFLQANLFEVAAADLGTFDVVFCMGVLYHVSKHVNLLEWIARVNTDLLVIDTNLSQRRGSVLEIRHDDLSVPGNACDHELVMYPSRAAVLDLGRQFDYRLVVLRPNFTSYEGAEDFQQGARRAFLCAKQSSLDGIAAAVEAEEDPRRHLLKVPAGILVRALWTKALRRLGLVKHTGLDR
jgi:SAM-dependent methyltransferase